MFQMYFPKVTLQAAVYSRAIFGRNGFNQFPARMILGEFGDVRELLTVSGRELAGGACTRGLIRVRTGWSPTRARGQGPFGGQFKPGIRSVAIYSEDLVPFVILFRTHPPAGIV